MVWKGVPMKKLLFIVNPRAGKTKSRAPLFDAVAQFSRAGYLVRVYITEPAISPPGGAGSTTWWSVPAATAR
mgnify:CR=1 FL=1